jgi:hypothetical protein
VGREACEEASPCAGGLPQDVQYAYVRHEAGSRAKKSRGMHVSVFDSASRKKAVSFERARRCSTRKHSLGPQTVRAIGCEGARTSCLVTLKSDAERYLLAGQAHEDDSVRRPVRQEQYWTETGRSQRPRTMILPIRSAATRKRSTVMRSRAAMQRTAQTLTGRK